MIYIVIFSLLDSSNKFAISYTDPIRACEKYISVQVSEDYKARIIELDERNNKIKKVDCKKILLSENYVN